MPTFVRFLLAHLVLLALPALGQQPQVKVTAEVSPNPIPANAAANYIVTVENGDVGGKPDLRLPAPLQAVGGWSESRQMQFGFGAQKSVTQFALPILSPEEGKFVIPGPEVSVNGSVVKANDVTVEVGAATPQAQKPAGVDASQDNGLGDLEPILQLRPGKTEFYQGEIVPVTATIYLPRTERMQAQRFGLIEVEKSDLAIQRFPQQYEQSVENIGGQSYVSISFRSSMSALKAGKMHVGPAKVELQVELYLRGNRGGFPFAMGVGGERRKLTLKAAATNINVLPLPKEGRPANFSGAVGDFKMTAAANVTDLNVGDPVAVDLTIEGQGNFDAIEAPVLSDSKGWRTYPPKRYAVDSNDPNTADLINRRIGFNVMLVPEKVQPAVPPFEFSFFSPRTKQYTHLRSQPIPLNVKPGANAPAPAAAVSGTVTSQTPANVAPEADITDILMVMPAQPRWLTTVTPLRNDFKFLALNAALLTALLGLIGYALWQRHRASLVNSPQQQLRASWQKLESQGLSEADFYSRAMQYLRLVSPASVPERAQKIAERYEALNFAGASAGQGPIPEAERAEVLQLLRSIKPAANNALPPPLQAGALGLLLVMALPMTLQASPADDYQSMVTALEKKDFASAQKTGEQLVQSGQISAELFILLGHAAYKQGQPGLAAMWYQRAQMFPGNASELRQNLRHIEEKTHFFSFEGSQPMLPFARLLSRNAWLWLCAVGGWAVLFSITMMIVVKSNARFAVAMPGLLLGLLVTGLALTGWLCRPTYKDVQALAFVTDAKAQAHTAASQVSGSVINVPPGSVVRVLDERQAWSYVEIPQPGVSDSLRGWLPSSQLQHWWPWDAALLP